jgi:hypothetical protein
MIHFGSTCILFENYSDADETRLMNSTKTRNKLTAYDNYPLLKNQNSRQQRTTSLIKRGAKSMYTFGEKPKEKSFYVTVYNHNIYMRRM